MTAALASGAVLHDARSADEFTAGHVAGAISVPADGRLAETVGMVLTPDQRIVLLTPEGMEQETATRLARIGYDHVLGFVADPEEYLVRHAQEVTQASRLRVDQLEGVRADVQVVDVRNPGEVAAGMIPGAIHIPLAELRTRADELDRDRPVVVSCAGGWRSSVAASYLRAQGHTDVSDLLGGYNAWSAAHPQAS